MRRWLALGWALAFGLAPTLPAQQGKKEELDPVEFKAAFLSKIPPYIEWPASAFAESQSQVVVGVLGDDAVFDLLTALFKGRKVGTRDVVVKKYENLENTTNLCHILFVGASGTPLWREWSKGKELTGLLSIGETDDFIQKMGGVFALSVANHQLEISLKNARKAKLEVSSKLLHIAKVHK